MNATAGLMQEYGELVGRANQAGDELKLCFDRLSQLESKLMQNGIRGISPDFPAHVNAALKTWRQDPFWEARDPQLRPPSFMLEANDGRSSV